MSLHIARLISAQLPAEVNQLERIAAVKVAFPEKFWTAGQIAGFLRVLNQRGQASRILAPKVRLHRRGLACFWRDC